MCSVSIAAGDRHEDLERGRQQRTQYGARLQRINRHPAASAKTANIASATYSASDHMRRKRQQVLSGSRDKKPPKLTACFAKVAAVPGLRALNPVPEPMTDQKPRLALRRTQLPDAGADDWSVILDQGDHWPHLHGAEPGRRSLVLGLEQVSKLGSQQRIWAQSRRGKGQIPGEMGGASARRIEPCAPHAIVVQAPLDLLPVGGPRLGRRATRGPTVLAVPSDGSFLFGEQTTRHLVSQVGSKERHMSNIFVEPRP